jgi:hypothetical protein
LKKTAVFLFVILICLLANPLFGQTPLLQVDENTLGEVTLDNPAPRFSFEAQANTPLTLQADSLSSDFAPLLLVYDEREQPLQRMANPLGLARLSMEFIPPADATYTLQVMGVDAHVGQFVLSLTLVNAEQTNPASELRNGMVIEDRVTPSEPVHRYQFTSARETALTIQLISLLPDASPAFILTDLDGNPLGTSRNSLLGGSFFIPAAADVGYELMIVHSGADRIEGYSLSLLNMGSTTAQPTTPLPQTDTPAAQVTAIPTINADTQGEVIIPFDGPCALTTREPAGVNVREGPALEYGTTGGLFPNVIVPVTGRNEDNTWWQVEHRAGNFGWVADVVVRRGGDCTNIGVAAYPPLPSNIQPTPTLEGTIPLETPTVEG